jgi:hypothetical protein
MQRLELRAEGEHPDILGFSNSWLVIQVHRGTKLFRAPFLLHLRSSCLLTQVPDKFLIVFVFCALNFLIFPAI